jgi:hypothetical protein
LYLRFVAFAPWSARGISEKRIQADNPARLSGGATQSLRSFKPFGFVDTETLDEITESILKSFEGEFVSTSFDVYPTIDTLPSFSDLLTRTNNLLETKLKALGLNRTFILQFSLENKEGLQLDMTKNIDLTEDN